MPLPASVTTVPVHIKILGEDGRSGKGRMSFVGPVALRDGTGNVIVGPPQFTVALDANGEATVSLIATDDPDISPSGWAYTVTVATDVWRPEPFQIQIPAATVGTLELADIAPAVTPITLVTYETPAGAQAKADAAQAAAITSSAQRASNLSDLASASTARTNLGLGGAAVLSVGATAGTVAAGDDSRIAGAVQSSVVDAKGDLVVGDADNAVTRLPVGADRRVPAADSSQPAGIRWTDPLGLEFVTTSIQGSLGTGSNAWPVANDARYARVLGSGTISKIGLEVMTASGNISVAVYSKTGTGINAQPGARVATSGAIACPPVGYVEISLGGSISVSDGDYLALSCDNAVAAFRGVSGSVNRLAAVISFAQSAAHPLPPTATPVASASRIPLLIGIP